MYGDLAPEVQHEIFKATQDLKPQIMESLYAIFGKTPALLKRIKSNLFPRDLIPDLSPGDHINIILF